MEAAYDDGRVALDDDGVTLRRYDLLLRTRRVPYSSIARASERAMDGWWRWRLWGTNDLKIWLGWDPSRRHKDRMIVLDTTSDGMRVGLTPDDHEAVVEILARRVGRVGRDA